jgi:pyrimidine-nucleoside phosphorylase
MTPTYEDSDKRFFLKGLSKNLTSLLPVDITLTHRESIQEILDKGRGSFPSFSPEAQASTLISTHTFEDKTALILVPLLASAGIHMPKTLGFYPGTENVLIDRLRCFHGFQHSLSAQKMKDQLDQVGAFISTLPASIMPSISNLFLQLREQNQAFWIQTLLSLLFFKIHSAVFDIGIGQGALAELHSEAHQSARVLKNICDHLNIKSAYILRNADQPIGQAHGLCLEAIESINVLKGKGPYDVLKLCLELGTEILLMTKSFSSRADAKRNLKEKLISGEALDKFKDIIESQNGETKILEDSSLLPLVKEKVHLLSPRKGYLQSFPMRRLSTLRDKLCRLHSGAGLVLLKKAGELTEAREVLAELYIPQIQAKERILKEAKDLFSISEHPPAFSPLIVERIRD